MPLVPSQEDKISTDVPGLDVGANRFGQVGAAVAQMGAQLENTASVVGEHIKRMEAVSSSQAAAMRAKTDGETVANTLSANSVDGYVKLKDAHNQDILDSTTGGPTYVQNDDGSKQTISQAYRKWANDRFQKDQLALPSDMAQQMYQREAGGRFTDDINLLQHQEFASRAKATNAALDTSLKNMAINRLNYPDTEGMYSDHLTGIDAIMSQGNAGGFPASEVPERIIKWGQEISGQYVEGRIIQIQDIIAGNRRGNAAGQMDNLNKLENEIKGDLKYDKDGNVVTTKAEDGRLKPVIVEGTATERRTKAGLPTLTQLLGETQKWRLLEKIEALKHGPAPEADIANLRAESSDLAARSKGAQYLTSQGDRDALDAATVAFLPKVLKTMDQVGPTKLSPRAALTDLLLPQMMGRVEGILGSEANKALSPADKLLKLDSAMKQVFQGSANLNETLNAHCKDPSYFLKPGEGIAAAQNRLRDGMESQIKSEDVKMHTNFGDVMKESGIGARTWTKTLGALDPKKDTDFQAPLTAWTAAMNAQKASSKGVYDSSPNVPPQFAEAIANRFKSPGQDPEQLSALLKGFNYPEGNSFIKEMVDQKLLPYKSQFANMFPENVRQAYTQTIFNEKGIAKDYALKYASLHNDKKPDQTQDSGAVESMVQREFGAQALAAGGYNPQLGGDPTQVHNGIVQMIATRAMQNYVADDGREGDVSKYVKGAGTTLMKDLFETPQKAGLWKKLTKGQSDQTLAVPTNARVGGPLPENPVYLKATMDGTGKEHYATDEDRQTIADFNAQISRKGSLLVTKFGVVDPRTVVNGRVNPKSDVAPEDFKYLLDSSTADIRAYPTLRNGVAGVGFTYMGRTSPNGPNPSQPAQRVDVMQAGRDGVVHKFFMTYKEARAAGLGLTAEAHPPLKDERK